MSMFVGQVRLLDAGLVSVLRIDLREQGALGLYELIDPDGSSHVWQVDLTSDTDSTCFEDRGCFALVCYLVDLQAKCWTGMVEVVQAATGFSVGRLVLIANQFNVLCSSQKPEGITCH